MPGCSSACTRTRRRAWCPAHRARRVDVGRLARGKLHERLRLVEHRALEHVREDVAAGEGQLRGSGWPVCGASVAGGVAASGARAVLLRLGEQWCSTGHAAGARAWHCGSAGSSRRRGGRGARHVVRPRARVARRERRRGVVTALVHALAHASRPRTQLVVRALSSSGAAAGPRPSCDLPRATSALHQACASASVITWSPSPSALRLPRPPRPAPRAWAGEAAARGS